MCRLDTVPFSPFRWRFVGQFCCWPFVFFRPLSRHSRALIFLFSYLTCKKTCVGFLNLASFGMPYEKQSTVLINQITHSAETHLLPSIRSIQVDNHAAPCQFNAEKDFYDNSFIWKANRQNQILKSRMMRTTTTKILVNWFEQCSQTVI